MGQASHRKRHHLALAKMNSLDDTNLLNLLAWGNEAPGGDNVESEGIGRDPPGQGGIRDLGAGLDWALLPDTGKSLGLNTSKGGRGHTDGSECAVGPASPWRFL